MKNLGLSMIILNLLICFLNTGCYSNQDSEKIESQRNYDYPDEIIFYTNGDSFAPVITLQGDAKVLWTWADNDTSNSVTPVKNYSSSGLRVNRLKVTPWSAVRRINIGYDAEDNGSPNIEIVADQKVSQVENLHLVAPYLIEWCSSYNMINYLDFSNFSNLETIECFLSTSLKTVDLTNTNKLKRVCFEYNNIENLNLSNSPFIQDLRAAGNDFDTIILPDKTDSIWHICVHHNQFSSQNFFNNMNRFPNIADLLIDNANQSGDLIITKTNPNRSIEIRAFGNTYTSIDFRGALKNKELWGIVDMDHNKLSKVNLTGCVQIKTLDLSYNNLTSAEIDNILQQMDDLGSATPYGNIDLRFNQPPTLKGLEHKSNLEKKGWTVHTDQNILISSMEIIDNLNNDTIIGIGAQMQFEVDIKPENATNQQVGWSVENLTGEAIIDSNGLLTTFSQGNIKVIAEAKDESKSKSTKDYVITIPVGIQNNLSLATIKVFPNPTKGEIQIQMDQFVNQGIYVELRNLNGQLLLKKRLFEPISFLSLKNFNTNIYFLTIMYNDMVTIHKIIKN